MYVRDLLPNHARERVKDVGPALTADVGINEITVL